MQPNKQKAFKELVNEHQAYLRAFIRSMGIAPAWVDDIAQEVFILAYNKFDELENEGVNWGNWLWAVARNLIKNELRKSARRNRTINNSLTEMLLEKTSHTFVEKVHEKEVFLVMAACIKKLPQGKQELFKNKYELKLKASQLASQINSTEEAVRQMLMQIRRNVQACMEKTLGEVAL